MAKEPNKQCTPVPGALLLTPANKLSVEALLRTPYGKGVHDYCKAINPTDLLNCADWIIHACAQEPRDTQSCPALDYMPAICPTPGLPAKPPAARNVPAKGQKII